MKYINNANNINNISLKKSNIVYKLDFVYKYII